MRTRSSRRTSTVALATLLTFSLVAAACGDDDDSTDEPDSTEAADGEEAGTDEDGQDGESDDDAGEPTTTLEIVEGEIDTDDVVEEPEEEAESGPVVGGTLRIGLEADVDGLNPATSSWSSPGYAMGNAVFDALSRWDADNNAVPYLAESFTPNEDFTSWTMTLREGVTFHDGTPLNADAVIVNFETQLNDPIVGLAVRPFYPETGAVEKIDDLTVQYNLLEPNAYFPAALTSQLGYVASPAWLEAAVADPALNQEPVGTGPFVFDSRSPDSVTRFVRNQDWWGGEVYLDAVEFLPVTDPDTRTDLLFEGEIDGMQTTNPANIADLLDEESIQNIIDETGEESFAMMNSAAPPFDDIRARRALALATPLENYRNLIGLGISRAANQRYIPESPYYNPDVVQEGDSPDEAVALATEYCADFPENCTDGKINIELQYSGPAVIQTRIADILEEGWQVAFNVSRQEIPQDDHIAETVTGQYNVVTWRQFGAIAPNNDNVWLLCRTIGGLSLNFPKFCDEERDALLLQAQATTDEAERISLYQQVEQKLNQDYLYVFFTHTTWDNAFNENVRGVCDHVTPDGTPLRCVSGGVTWYDDVWLTS